MPNYNDTDYTAEQELELCSRTIEKCQTPQQLQELLQFLRDKSCSVKSSVAAIFKSKQPFEVTDKLMMTKGSPYEFKVIGNLSVGEVKKGDEFAVFASFQATIKNTTISGDFHAMLGSIIIASEDANATTGIEVSEHQTTNVDKNRSHENVTRIGSFTADADYDDLKFNLIGYAAHTRSENGDHFIIDKDYGQLIAIKI